MADDYSAFAATEEEAALFHVAPFNYEPGQRKLIARIERAVKQANGDASMAGGSDITRLHNNGILYRPTLNGQRIVLPGERDGAFATTVSKIEGLGKKFIADVEGGVYDEQIKAAMEGQKASASKTTRKRSASSSKSDKPWALRKDWDQLSLNDQKAVSSRYRWGKNPDNSVIAEVGHKPDASISAERKKG